MAGQMIYFYYKNTNMMSHPNTIYEKKNSIGEGFATFADIILRSHRTRGPDQETPEPQSPITNRSKSTTHPTIATKTGG
jgi:hypothetical protein